MAQKVDYAALKKGGYMRQKQKGYGSLRLAVVGGNLTAENIKTVAEVAEKYGRGYVHMTSRQGIEIPFIKVEELAEVKEALAKGGVGTGVCGPRVRTVTACQGSEVCPSGCIDTYTLAKELDERYFGRELPHKFKFGVTGCQNNCLKAEENDVGIKGGMNIEYKEDDCISCGVCVKACRQDALKMVDGKIELDAQKCNHCGRCVKSCPVDAWKGTPGYIVSFGGTFGNNIYKGEELLPLIPDKETLFRVTDAAINFFEKNANPSERFRKTLQRVGEEDFRSQLKDAYEGQWKENIMAELDFEVTDEVDITDKVCPLTFVKAKVAIEELEDGEILAVRMNDGEPVQNVPRSMKEEGHKVLKLTDNEDGTYTMYVRKVED